jgi:hypothetical protein
VVECFRAFRHAGFFRFDYKELTVNGSCLKSIPVVALTVALGLTSLSNAGEPKAEATGSRIVLRISWEFIRKHHVPLIDETAPINKCLFGAHVTGQSHTTGEALINMDIEDGGDTVFTFHFKGTTIGKTVATHAPVAVFSTGTTNFEAQRAIRFDGLRFTAEPASIRAAHTLTIDGVCAPRGLIGRIARSRAWASIRQNGPTADAISLHDTKALVMASFNRDTERLVKDLNRVVPLEETVGLLVPGTQNWVTRIGRNKEFIMISRGPKDTDIPVLPKEFLHLKAPVELWIRGQPVGEGARRLLEVWGEAHRSLDRFRALLSQKATKVEGLKFSAVGDWWVIKVGEDLLGPLVEKIEENSKPMKK